LNFVDIFPIKIPLPPTFSSVIITYPQILGYPKGKNITRVFPQVD
jgi:hypothetical protein